MERRKSTSKEGEVNVELQEIKRRIKAIKNEHGITHSHAVVEEVGGKLKFVALTLRFKVDKDDENKTLDFS